MPLSSEEWMRLEVLRRELNIVSDKVVVNYLLLQIQELENKMKAQSSTAS